jgi:hypothetical protein
MIGNPPYGVKVVPGAHYADVYDLQSQDSYGFFVVNALQRIASGARMIFIVSSSFLTIKSHQRLRKFILDNAKIIRVIKLHRATFPGIDIFPVILELEKCEVAAHRAANIYQYYDFWQFHPVDTEEELKVLYQIVLDDLGAKKPWKFDAVRTARYTVRQGVLNRFSRLPIFDALPTLFEYMQDVFAAPQPTLSLNSINKTPSKEVPYLKIRDRKVVQLQKIAVVKIGLQSGDNAKFYRVRPGVSGGAVKGGYKDVDAKNVVSAKKLAALTESEIQNGIEISDPTNDRYFVPLDKAALADIEGGFLNMFYDSVDFYIDWSSSAVEEMKSLRGARFQNAEYYFRKGISFSSTGLYSPTFRLSHGGVFDQKGSCIFSDYFEPHFLLGVLSSTLIKYFVKSFINHGVDAQLDEIPIAIPKDGEQTAILKKVEEIIAQQKTDPEYDYRPQLNELDDLVFALYNLVPHEIEEVRTWYRRRYPALFKYQGAKIH